MPILPAEYSPTKLDMRSVATQVMLGAQGVKFPVYIIDGNADLRRSFHFLLSTFDITVWPFLTTEDFLDELSTLAPGVILLDVRMDGLQMLTALRQRQVEWPVVVMTGHGDIAIAVRAIKLGAIEVLEKPFTPEVLEEALEQAFAALAGTQDAARARSDTEVLLRSLSPRETEVVSLLLEGLPNKMVAHRLALSTRTVEMHRSKAMTKLGVKSIVEAFALITTAGLSGHHAWLGVVA